MKEKKVLLYPFAEESIPLITTLHRLNPGYRVVSAVSPPGIGLKGRDAGFVDNRNPIGITVETELEKPLEKADVLLVTSESMTDSAHVGSMDAIHMAIRLKKEILCTLTLSLPIQEQIALKCEAVGVPFRYCAGEQPSFYDSKQIDNPPTSLYIPGAVVVLVEGLVEDPLTFEVLLSLTASFREQGHRVSAISDRSYCEFFNVHPVPSFLKSVGKTECEKIRGFNQYLRLLEREEHPELILIQVPGGMMKYNKMIANSFGVYAYLISQAVQADYSVCTVPYSLYEKELVEKLNHTFFERFGCGIDCTLMSGKMMNFMESIQSGEFHFLNMSTTSVEEMLSEIKNRGGISEKIPVYNGRTSRGLQSCQQRLTVLLDEQMDSDTLFE